MKIVTQALLFLPGAANVIRNLIPNDRDAVFNTMWIYPCRAFDAQGKRVANAASAWIGERTTYADVTPEELVYDGGPMPIQLPPGQTKLVRQVLVQVDDAADGVWAKWWIDPQSNLALPK